MSDITKVVVDDKAKPYKAYIATALTAVGTFAAYWIADKDPFTAKEIGEAALAALVASGLTGGATFQVKNPKKVKPAREYKPPRRRRRLPN